MGDVVSFPTALEDNQEFVADLCRFAENILSEAAVKKKYHFSDEVWTKLGEDDALVEKIEAEKLRRIRDGSSKREKAQALIVKGPGILDSIATDPAASPRHRVDAIKTLDGMATGGSEAGAPVTDRFVIQINIADTTLRFDKSRTPDVAPHHIDDTPQEEWLPVIAANKRKDDGGGGTI